MLVSYGLTEKAWMDKLTRTHRLPTMWKTRNLFYGSENPTDISYIQAKLEWMQSIFMRSPNDKLVQANDSDSPSTMNSPLLMLQYARPARPWGNLLSLLCTFNRTTTLSQQPKEVKLKYSFLNVMNSGACHNHNRRMEFLCCKTTKTNCLQIQLINWMCSSASKDLDQEENISTYYLCPFSCLRCC